MSLTERTGPSRTSTDGGSGPRLPLGELSWQLLVPGARAAAATWLVVALPALLAWVVAPLSTVSWVQALGVAGAGWFLGHGMPVSVGSTSISIAPLGLTLLVLWMTTRSVRRLLDDSEAAARGTTWPRQLGRHLLPGYAVGYAAVALLAWLLTLAGPVRPNLLAVLGALWVPAASVLWCLLRRHGAGDEAPLVGTVLDRVPRWVARSLGPGVRGAVVLVLLGGLLVVAAVLLKLSTVTGLHAALGAGVVGGAVLVLGQLLVVPNLALWAVSWCAGPGFVVADGSTMTLHGGEPGLLPLVPVLGALPSGGRLPGWLVLVLLVPVAVGVLVSHLALRDLARLSSWRTKAVTSATACLVAAVLVGLAASLGSGSAGVDRLRQMGPTPWLLTLALLGELLLGALLHLGVDRLRVHRR